LFGEKCDCRRGLQWACDPSQSERVNKARYCFGLCYSAQDLLPLSLVISQKLNQEFYSSGLVMGKHAVLVENRSAYINQHLFADYINTAFLPILRKVRTNPSLVSRLALLLINNCKAHMGDVFQKVLADYGVMMMTYGILVQANRMMSFGIRSPLRIPNQFARRGHLKSDSAKSTPKHP
jgi:hypothetical protein